MGGVNPLAQITDRCFELVQGRRGGVILAPPGEPAPVLSPDVAAVVDRRQTAGDRALLSLARTHPVGTLSQRPDVIP